MRVEGEKLTAVSTAIKESSKALRYKLIFQVYLVSHLVQFDWICISTPDTLFQNFHRRNCITAHQKLMIDVGTLLRTISKSEDYDIPEIAAYLSTYKGPFTYESLQGDTSC